MLIDLISNSQNDRFVYLQIVPALMKLLTSERMWTDVIKLISCLHPALLLLRLADKKSPSMDRLYYYVRQMYELLMLSRNKLDDLEDNYKGSNNKFSLHKMYQYFMQTCEITDYCNEFKFKNATNGDELNDNDYDSDDSSSGNELDEETNSDDDSVESAETSINLGERVVKKWELRQKKLSHDVAVAGWMLSPSPEVMRDVKDNHDGYHRNTVESVLKKWILFDVSIFISPIAAIHIQLTVFIFIVYILDKTK